MKPVLVQQLWLASSLVVAWLVMAIPVTMVAGYGSLGWLTLAAGLCFLPGFLVLLFQPLWKAAGAAGLGALSGAVLRMLFVAAAMLVVAVYRPDVSSLLFGIELSVFYAVALGVETLLIVRGLAKAEPIARG